MKTWFSALGISVMLFLVYGAIYILIGGLTALLLNNWFGLRGDRQ